MGSQSATQGPDHWGCWPGTGTDKVELEMGSTANCLRQELRALVWAEIGLLGPWAQVWVRAPAETVQKQYDLLVHLALWQILIKVVKYIKWKLNWMWLLLRLLLCERVRPRRNTYWCTRLLCMHLMYSFSIYVCELVSSAFIDACLGWHL